MKSYSLVALALALAACGQKGPLYMPDDTQGEVVTRPSTTNGDGTTSSPSNSPSTPDSPSRSASPAPEVVAPAGTPAEESKDPGSKDKSKKQPPQ
jgi:predicted small lipoprotein YifL